ncbi:MAG: sulfatase-like hydrolase/transferase [bacterium]
MKLAEFKFRYICLAAAVILCVCALSGSVFCQDASADKTPNIVIMTMLGVRNCDSIADPTHQYIPNLWHTLFKEGTLYTELVNSNNEFHFPPIYAIFTGVNYPFYGGPLRHPSIFQYVRKRYNLPQSKVWSIGNWYNKDYALETDAYPEKTFPCKWSVLEPSMPEQLKGILTKQELIFLERFSEVVKSSPEHWPNWDSLGKAQYRIFIRIMKELKPKLAHYVLGDVESAHSDTFGRYVLALKDCDEMINQTWEFLQRDPYYKDKTYFIVAIDHGRNLYFDDHYEDAYSGSERVWFYIRGPGIKKGTVIKRPVYHVDIFATLAHIMDIQTHRTQGRVLSDCFESARR